MSLEYDFEVEGDLLIVRTSGYDDDINEAVAYGEAIIKNCVVNKCSRLLMDETGMTEVLEVVFNILCHSFKLNAKALRSDLCPNPLTLIKPLKICSLVKT